jgi:hypothetical protein
LASLCSCLFLEPVLSLGLHLVEILPRVEDNSFPLEPPDAPDLPVPPVYVITSVATLFCDPSGLVLV